jgi:hypothetical protein
MLTDDSLALSVTTVVAREKDYMYYSVMSSMKKKWDQCDNVDKAMLLAMT